ncbi:MAG TPA: serine hydrolase [Balneolaceae bacterium]|nr:serine hydrolase [Balneolaceae bacterium]
MQAQPDMQAVKKNIQQRIHEKDILGISVGYIHPDGHASFFSRGYLSTGQKRRVNKHTIYEIGSVTKTFTALIFARMVQQHKIALDDSIGQFLPDSVHTPSYHGQKITLESLATHTSGLPRMPANFSPKSQLNPYVDYTARDLYQFLDHYKLKRAPGASYQYSNVGMGLLGDILMRVSGLSYRHLLKKYITSPLEMTNTYIHIPKSKYSQFAHPYFYGNPIRHWTWNILTGAGSIRSTTADMVRYMKAQMGFAPTQLYTAIKYTHLMRFSIGSNSDIGLAWLESTKKDTILWHNGGTGGFRSFIGYNKQTDTGVVILSSGRDNIDDIGFHLLDQQFALRPVKHSISVKPQVLAKYTGTYKLTPTFSIRITRDNDHLYARGTGQQKFRLYPESKTKFFLKPVKAEIRFIKDKKGKFTKLKLYQNGRVTEGAK